MNDRHADGHTAGPWFVGEEDVAADGPFIPIENSTGLTVARIEPDLVGDDLSDLEITDERRSFAHLIAALREARGFICADANGEHYERIEVAQILETIDAAIQEATGDR